MKNPIFDTASPLSKIFFLIFISFASFLIFLLIGLIISIPLFGIDFANLKDYFVLDNPANIGFIKFMQGLQSVGLFVAPPFIAAFLYSTNTFSYLKTNTKISISLIFLAGIIALLSIPIISFTASINSQMHLPSFLSDVEKWMIEKEQMAKVSTEIFLKADNNTQLFINLILVALIPAIGEELLFRGMLQRLFSELFKNIHVGIVVTAIIFSAIHFQFFGFFPRMFLGILFGYFFVWSRNIWVPIFAHFVNNAAGVIVYYKYQGNSQIENLEVSGLEQSQIFSLVIITIFVAGLIYFFKKFADA